MGDFLMPRRRRSRVYSRNQGGAVRYYGDFRDFSDVGGGREALIPSGAEQATTDERLAQLLAARRLTDLEGRRRRSVQGDPQADTYLAEYIDHHLSLKRRAGRVTDQWVEAAEVHLYSVYSAVAYFCNRGRPLQKDPKTGKVVLSGLKDRELGSLGVPDIQDYVIWLASRENGRGGTFSQSNQRKYLNSLSNLFRRAASERRVSPGHNPVASLLEKPQDGTGRGEARWLEVPDAALLLESARNYRPNRPDMAMGAGTLYAIVATMLLTGGRPYEVLGLEVRDISFERRIPKSQIGGKNAGGTRSLRPRCGAVAASYS